MKYYVEFIVNTCPVIILTPVVNPVFSKYIHFLEYCIPQLIEAKVEVCHQMLNFGRKDER